MGNIDVINNILFCQPIAMAIMITNITIQIMLIIKAAMLLFLFSSNLLVHTPIMLNINPSPPPKIANINAAMLNPELSVAITTGCCGVG